MKVAGHQKERGGQRVERKRGGDEPDVLEDGMQEGGSVVQEIEGVHLPPTIR